MVAVGLAAVVVLIAGAASATHLRSSEVTPVERVVSVRRAALPARTTTTVRRSTPSTTSAAPAATTTTMAPRPPAPPTSVDPTTTTTRVARVARTAPTAAPAPAPTPTAPPTTTAPVAPVISVVTNLSAATQQQMLALVNVKRATGLVCGGTSFAPVPPLTLNGTLTQAADGHARDMAARNYFSHTGANGSDPGTRITAAGYHWTAWAENIAAGQTSPESVVAGWFDSAGHCANFMAPVVTQIGFARADNPSSTYGIYWVADMGRP